MVDAPIQYNLGQLPSVLLERCKASYEKRPAGANPNPSFRDYVVSGFGQELADLFLIPQNQKTMSADLSKLSQAGVRRFFPPPDDQKVRQGMEKMPRAAGAEYNSRFWYPKEGGIQRLVDGLAGGLKDLRVRQTVVKLDLEKRRLHTRDGQCYGWGKAISSIPLRDLCLMTGDRESEEAARPLSSGATVIFNVGVRGNVPEQLKGVHWVYVPEATLPFYRVGVYSNISPGPAPSTTMPCTSRWAIPAWRSTGRMRPGSFCPKSWPAWRNLAGWIRPPSAACAFRLSPAHMYT